jgi:dCMP deaminase
MDSVDHALKWHLRFLGLARLVSTWSRDPSTQTGAAIVDGQKRILSVGFNGFPQPMPDRPEHYLDRQEKYSRIVHAEVNALLFAGRLPPGSVLYTWPFMSCDRCVVQMLQGGIRTFVAPEATSEQLERWGSAFERARQYIAECDGRLIELPRTILEGIGCA